MSDALWGGLIDEAGDVAGAAFRWMGERDRAKYETQAAQAWAQSYATAAPAIAAGQVATATTIQAQQNRLLIAGMAILAVVVLFRIRPTANN
jgi:hypothetical protein